MTQYLIAKNDAGQIIAKRASESQYDYAFATARGTFHSRLDLVPAGQRAYKVEQITGAEYRALVKAETETVELLTSKLERAEQNLAGWREVLLKQEHRATLDIAALPTREVKNRYISGTRTEVLVGDEWTVYWALEPEHIKSELLRYTQYVHVCEKRVANYRKRLASAQRKAAKVEG